jgi:toxin-antitoxin system PIN domain toxin
MPFEPGVLDANILVYAVNTSALQHSASRRLLEAALDPAAALYVTLQILCEFYSVVTNPKRIASAFTAAEATQMIADLLELPGLRVLATPSLAARKLAELLKHRSVTAASIFDLQIAATMQANDVQRIYTFNTGDFADIPDLEAVIPQDATPSDVKAARD